MLVEGSVPQNGGDSEREHEQAFGDFTKWGEETEYRSRQGDKMRDYPCAHPATSCSTQVVDRHDAFLGSLPDSFQSLTGLAGSVECAQEWSWYRGAQHPEAIPSAPAALNPNSQFSSYGPTSSASLGCATKVTPISILRHPLDPMSHLAILRHAVHSLGS